MLKKSKATLTLAGAIALALAANRNDARAEQEPEPITFAEPAMSGLGLLVPHAGGLYMPRFPSIDLAGQGTSGSVPTPQNPEGLVAFGVSQYMGGGLGLHPTLSLGVDFGLAVAGVTSSSFAYGGQTYAGKDSFWWGIRLPSPGLAWHKTGYIVAAQIVPELAWMSAQFTDQGGNRLVGNKFLFMASADVQFCREYNLGGVMEKNSAVCLYAAPVIYGGDFFNGASLGVRAFLF